VLEAINILKLQNGKNHFCIAAIYLISILLYSCKNCIWSSL